MSRTLFWYLFKDLIKIFFLASGVIAGIMSFGGLLRPLTHQGLEAGQVGRMLIYLMPAMTTYSLPIAALFATTIVYGRLSADNELTACRAAGLSHLAIATPAVVLGLAVAMISLLFLCFIVPAFAFKVEQTIYSNIGQLLVHGIEQNHQIRVGPSKDTVFAQHAYFAPPDPAHPEDQCVVLGGPTIVRDYEKVKGEDGQELLVPKNFYMAQHAVVSIHQAHGQGQDTVTVALDGGVVVPRDLKGNDQGFVQVTQVGPIPIESRIHENTKFMDIVHLKQLYRSPETSERVGRALDQFVRREQQAQFGKLVLDELTGPKHHFTLASSAETFELSTSGKVLAEWHKDELRLFSRNGSQRRLHLSRHGLGEELNADAHELHLHFTPDNDNGQMNVSMELQDAVIRAGDEPTTRPSFPSQVTSVPMPPPIRGIPYAHSLEYYCQDPKGQACGDDELRNDLERSILKITNSIVSEMHARASFAISCLILVMVGCALGMMFRSGNFLSAFALSVMPALLCITLIGAGQQTAENVPDHVLNVAHLNNPLNLGLGLIWSGNVIVSGIAVTLLGKLQRQ